MTTETTDNRHYTIKVARNLPLSEQVHYANDLLCLEALAREKCTLENIETRDGHMTLTYRLWQRQKGLARR